MKFGAFTAVISGQHVILQCHPRSLAPSMKFFPLLGFSESSTTSGKNVISKLRDIIHLQTTGHGSGLQSKCFHIVIFIVPRHGYLEWVLKAL